MFELADRRKEVSNYVLLPGAVPAALSRTFGRSSGYKLFRPAGLPVSFSSLCQLIGVTPDQGSRCAVTRESLILRFGADLVLKPQYASSYSLVP